MLTISPVAAFSDNYIWVLHNQSDAIAVDPGDARPLLAFLEQQDCQLSHVLITHHHYDHTDGLATLKAHFPALTIIGPAQVSLVNQAVTDGDTVSLAGLSPFQVMAVPGHTLDHLAYYCAPWLFCGDTLFAAGCGRILEGTPAMMYHSLMKLAALPPETLIYPTHEYTLANLAFASAAEPFNSDINQRIKLETNKRNHGQPTLPSTMALELATNPFLRCEQASIHQSLAQYQAKLHDSQVDIFAALREWKNNFTPVPR